MWGVSASARDDAWAVASFRDSRKPRILHWDGRVWKEISNPSPFGTLESVEAVSTDDVWAVGTGPQLITEHWDGSSWTLVPAPSPGAYDNFYDVSASSSTNVWAAGYFISDHAHPFAEHWDGTAWTLIYTPEEVAGVFTGVEAISPDDVWAVGYQDVGFADFQPLIEHWDGSAWTVVSAPFFLGTNNFLYDVSAASSTDVWAVGNYRPDDIKDLPLTLHWDGTAWSQVKAPSAGVDLLEGVIVISPTDVWAVGISFFTQDPLSRPFSLHWDGTAWTLRPAPVPGQERAVFHAVGASGPNDIWAVGEADTHGYFAEHSRGPCPV